MNGSPEFIYYSRVCIGIIYIYGCHCMCSPCIILTHINRVGVDGGGGGKNKQDPLMLLQ